MNFGGTQLTNTKANNVITGEGLRNFTNIRLQSGTSAFNSFLYELTQLLEEQKVKEALSSATQAAIENVNRAISLEPLLDSIKKEYAKAIENYKKLRITPLQKIRGILLANPNLPTRNIGLYIIYQFQGSLGAIKEEVNKLSDGYDTVFSMFLSEDGIKKQLVNGVGLDIETLSQTTTSGYKIVEAPEGAVFTGASNFYTGVLEEIPKLNEIEIFFAGLKVNATESKNFQLINFLDKNKSKAIEVIKRLIAEREFDEEGDFELDEYK
jgi:hypothetical protein